MEDEWDDGFFGRPFEALGNVNDAIYAPGAASLADRLPEFIEKGRIIKERTLREGDLLTMLFLYPGEGPVNMGLLVSNAGPENKMTVMSLYPVLRGRENRLKVENFKSWENGYEGMVSGDTGIIGLIAFFDPFFYYEHWNLKVGSKFDFELSALAFTLEIARNDEFEVTEGPLYEMALKEFLRDNPEKAKGDFPTPKVIMGSAQMLWPTNYTGEYHYRALVLDRQEVGFLQDRLWRFHLSLLIDEEAPSPEIWLYASPHIIKGATPKIGDYIEGFCWMEGFLRPGRN